MPAMAVNHLREELVGLFTNAQQLTEKMMRQMHEVLRDDPALRGRWAFDWPEHLRPPTLAEVEERCAAALDRLAELVADCGTWPGRSLLGDEDAAVACHIAQLADTRNDERRALLPLVEDAMRAGEIDPEE